MVLVKLDSPKGGHYAGGDIAAPVTQIVLRAALAARDAALNREDLAASEKQATSQSPKGDASTTNKLALRSANEGPRTNPESYDPNGNLSRREAAEAPKPYVVDLPAAPRPAPAVVTARPVPDVRGLSVREAVRALHNAGFRVRLLSAASSGTSPAAGTIAAPGTIVQLVRPLE